MVSAEYFDNHKPRHPLKGLALEKEVFPFIFLFIFILSILEPQASLMALTFECVSALSTVGSSLNLTPVLCDASKLLVALLMFIGRVGLITLMLGIVKQKKNTKYRYPSDNIIIN